MANPVHDSPDKTYLKVDFGTILKRRRRTPEDYVRTQGITTGKALESHLLWLTKTYVVSDKFANACRVYIRKLEKTNEGVGENISSDDEKMVSVERKLIKPKKSKTKKSASRTNKGS